MDKAIVLAVAASLCTATSSVCQRLGARKTQMDGFDPRLIVRLARRPVWLAGIGAMILEFACQVSALHFGALALVQPILALELLFVFAYMAVLGSRRYSCATGLPRPACPRDLPCSCWPPRRPGAGRTRRVHRGG
jgi:hypothetical protein